MIPETNRYPGVYLNSSELARATPHVRLSRPTPPDNTEWFDHDHQTVKEAARVALCFDCQQAIEPGKGLQVRRNSLSFEGVPLSMERNDFEDGLGVKLFPMHALVHPDCNLRCGDGH